MGLDKVLPLRATLLCRRCEPLRLLLSLVKRLPISLTGSRLHEAPAVDGLRERPSTLSSHACVSFSASFGGAASVLPRERSFD